MEGFIKVKLNPIGTKGNITEYKKHPYKEKGISIGIKTKKDEDDEEKLRKLKEKEK